MISPANVVQLRTLVAVVQHGSFAGAAHDLGYSPSAVSQQIAALEHTWKVELFERRPRSVHPTPAAREIVERASAVLAELDQLGDLIQALSQGSQGSLRIGAFGTASRHLLPTAVRTFADRYPGSKVALKEGLPTDLLQALVSRELDVALVYSYGPARRRPKWMQELKFVELLSERMLLLLPVDHRFAESSPVTLTDLGDETWITSHEGTPGAEELEELSAAAGMTPRIGFRTNDIDAIERLVREHVGVALIPALAFVPMIGVRYVSLADPNAIRLVYAAYSGTEARPVILAFVDALRQVAKSLVRNDSADIWTYLPESPA
jgi:DNA-binding transcriptional LysR family regulator